MTINFKPQLAKDIDFATMKWRNEDGSTRVVASPKLDGIRAIVLGGVVMSRKLKPIPNRFVQQRFGGMEWFDGELILGDPTSPTVYHDTYSAVMSEEGKPDVRFFCFDHVKDMDRPFCRRLIDLQTADDAAGHVHVTVLHQVGVHSEEELRDYEEWKLGEGYEGVMVRLLDGKESHYKRGRSTPKSGPIWKVKRFSDKEAVIIGFEEEMANLNEAVVDALGHTKRSSHQANKVGKGRLGALICEDPVGAGIEFRIGTGFTAAQRQDLWDRRDELLGQLVKFKSFDIGVKDAPRFPVFLGLRATIDA